MESPKRIRWLALGVLIVVPIVAALVVIKLGQFKAMAAAGANMVMPPERVNVAEVREENWQPRISAVGSVARVRGATSSAEAAGIGRAIHFEAGSDVKAGDLLVALNVDVEQAQLREAEATAAEARSYLDRVKDAAKTGSVAASELDAADARVK